jgi:hypothetical protein
LHFVSVGVVFVGVFFAMRLHLTDVGGAVDTLSDNFSKTKNELKSISVAAAEKALGTGVAAWSIENRCRWVALSVVDPSIASIVANLAETESGTKSALRMMASAELYLKDSSTYTTSIKDCEVKAPESPSIQLYPWRETPEWSVLREALKKEAPTIVRAAKDAGVPARILVTMIVPEQLRFYTSEREVYKRYFEPLKVLGNETQFSLGVSGIKDDTGAQIESHLRDVSSPYYLGDVYQHLLDFTTEDKTGERFSRLTAKDHYYSYLYTGLFVHQVETQWQQFGFPITDRPEILATIFNLGFVKSVPKENPEVGGSLITLGEKQYTFGGLAFDFYYSGELADEFPLQ